MRGLALLAVIALLVAGCFGGSGDTTTRDETRLEQPSPKPDYLSVADAICRNHRSRRTDLESRAAELGPIGSPAEAHRIAKLLRQEADNRMAEVRELDALQPPPAEAAVVRPILSGIRAETRLIENWADTYDDLDLERTRRLQIRLGVIAAETERRAQAFGFSVCGQR
jgi:hypothetical protein